MRALFPVFLIIFLLIAGLAVASDISTRCRISDLDIPASATLLQTTEVNPVTYSTSNLKVPNFTGTIRVYIVEPTSRYFDYNFTAYENGFLDFAINQSISIPYQDSITLTQVWNGSSAGFGDITETNIGAVAVVFNDEGVTNYSDPPTARPFTAYYTDACAMALAGETVSDNATGAYTHTVFIEEGTAHG
ncbi:MAG: hypothetical protein KAR42_12715 [candidate division Zixibacteria bacterium]|nr:hypothetical protein [candidate division Zixibacteria bacterium]